MLPKVMQRYTLREASRGKRTRRLRDENLSAVGG